LRDEFFWVVLFSWDSRYAYGLWL